MKFHELLTSLVLVYVKVVCCQNSVHNNSSQFDPQNTMSSAAEVITTDEGAITETAEETPPIHPDLERSRIARLRALQQHVLDSLGWERPPDIDSERKDSLLRELSTPVFVSRQKHCYYPACDLPMIDLPDYMNRSIWFDSSSRNIRYFFSIPTDTDTDPNRTITSAVVKLHLKRREDCPCAYDRDISTSRLHIKIYSYRRPIRSHSRLRHSNMRLIDAKMVSWEGSRWVALSVTEAVRRIVTRGRRNGGFEVQVRDMEENTIDAKTIIDPTVCTFQTNFQCNDDSDSEETEEPDEPNYSPVLEIVSTTRTVIHFGEHGMP